MPTVTCPQCGQRVSFSKVDKFENAHVCFQKFRDRIKTKPVVSVELKRDESPETEIPNIAASDSSASEIERETSAVESGNKFPRRRAR
jgi:hypothetical protein